MSRSGRPGRDGPPRRARDRPAAPLSPGRELTEVEPGGRGARHGAFPLEAPALPDRPEVRPPVPKEARMLMGVAQIAMIAGVAQVVVPLRRGNPGPESVLLLVSSLVAGVMSLFVAEGYAAAGGGRAMRRGPGGGLRVAPSQLPSLVYWTVGCLTQILASLVALGAGGSGVAMLARGLGACLGVAWLPAARLVAEPDQVPALGALQAELPAARAQVAALLPGAGPAPARTPAPDSVPGVLESRLVEGDEAVCDYCGCAIAAADQVRCAQCETPHHKDCWADYGGCTVYGCGGEVGLAPKA